MRLFVLTLALIAGLVGTSKAQAQSRSVESRVERLERRVIDQERAIDDLYERLDRMDRRGPRPLPPTQPPMRLTYNCMLVDAGYTKTFSGSGSTQLDAEFAVKQACEKSVNASYCQVTPKCDTSGSQGSVGAVCMITDAGYSKTFRGEGSSPIAAEAAAKVSCQSSVNASYCGNVKARCELKY